MALAPGGAGPRYKQAICKAELLQKTKVSVASHSGNSFFFLPFFFFPAI